MRKVAFILYAVLTVIMATATFVENSYGTEFTHKHIYGSWWFYLLWAVAIIMSVPCIPKHFSIFGRIFRKLRNNNSTKTIVIGFILSCPIYAASAIASTPYHISVEEAEQMKCQQVAYNGRICPLNTVARDFIQKISGKHSHKGLSPEQVLVSWSVRPEAWKNEKIIKVKKTSALKELGIEGNRASFSDFFDKDMNYVFKPNQYPDIEEKLTIIIMATRGELFEPLPEEYHPLSGTKVKAEIFYNSISWNLILFICCFTLAFFSFDFFSSRRKNIFYATKGLTILTSITLASCLILRWYVAEHLPLTNTFETMQVVALSTLTLACLSDKWRTYALIVSGATLLVTHISSLDPQITPLMPALQSPWLASHVTSIMISYALFAILLFLPDRKILIWAEILLAIGITLGSIWAKDAWGTFWSWDPKETWALISLIVYMYPLHEKDIPWFRNKNHQKWYLRFAFLTILMTYFGCNYILTGMHSYAQ